jgi:hypothetical protein
VSSPREYPPEELPPHDQLADADDELDWEREQYGRMADAAAPPPETVPYASGKDPR